jgi:GxxExxY protein
MSDQCDPITEKNIGAAIEVHRIMGPGLLEAIYLDALCVELELRGIPHQRQVDHEVFSKGHRFRNHRIDLVVAGEVIVEIKSVRELPEVAMAQVISYLKATGLKRGLLINFGARRLTDGVKRISL